MSLKLHRRLRWRRAVLAIAALGFVLRLILIAHSNGGADLGIYRYFSGLALHGVNPYSSPPGGLFPPVQGNSPPVEVAAFTGLLAIHDSPSTLRLLFAVVDAAIVLLVGLCFPRSRRWRLRFILFYAFNPFVLLAWTVFAEDKTILFLGIAVWLLALERGRERCAWAAAGGLTVFKFLGAFAAPVLAVHSFRTAGWRALAPIGAFIAIFVLSNLPWFPQSLEAFSRRDARLAIDPPIHASPTLVLARIGIYAPIDAKLLTAAALVAAFAAFLAGRIDVRDAVVWSLFGGYVFLPDDAFNRLLLITLPFLMVLELSRWRWVILWVVSSVVALAAVIETRGVPHGLGVIAGPLRTIFAHEGTLQHVIWMNLLPALVLAFYFAERRRPASARATTP